MCKPLGVLICLNQKLFMKYIFMKLNINWGNDIFFFTFFYFQNFIDLFCHTFMMYKLLLKFTITVVRNYRVLYMYNNESFTQFFLESSLQKMRVTSCILQRYTFLKVTMIYSPRPFYYYECPKKYNFCRISSKWHAGLWWVNDFFPKPKLSVMF